MKRFFIFLAVFFATIAQSQTMGGSSGPVIWSGSYGQVLPNNGIRIPYNSGAGGITFPEDPPNGTSSILLRGYNSLAFSRTWTIPTSAADQTVVGDTLSITLTNKGIDCANNTCTNIPAGSMSGVVPLANGGTNKNMTAVNGGLVYTDADSMEVTSAGTSQNWVLSGGAGAPTMSNTTTTAKTIDGSADAVQLTVEGNGTQTNDILAVQKSDTTNLLAVTNVNGTKIRGTTTNDSAATGYVGEYQSASLASGSAVSLTTDTAATVTSLTLSPGNWEVCGSVAYIYSTTTSITAIRAGLSKTNNSMPSTSIIGIPNDGESYFLWSQPAAVPGSTTLTANPPCSTTRLSASTTFYLIARTTFTSTAPTAYGGIWATRIR